MLNVGVISLFPEMFSVISDFGVTGRASKTGLLTLQLWNPRDFTSDVHRTVDDRPYGGGPGMVMLAEPLSQCLQQAKQALPKARVVYMSPQGERLDQQRVKRMAGCEQLILLCGRYEGVDERFLDNAVDEQWSIGDYVLSGGELAAMVVIDSISRILPGVLGHADSAAEDSFYQGLLDCPHYTRPERWQQSRVPEVLLSGDHAAIRRWRLKQALGRTWQRRPDLLEERALTDEEYRLLAEFQHENS